jgi:hypothetical protein
VATDCGVPGGRPNGGGAGAGGSPVSVDRGVSEMWVARAWTVATSASSTTRNRPRRSICGVGALILVTPAGSFPCQPGGVMAQRPARPPVARVPM